MKNETGRENVALTNWKVNFQRTPMVRGIKRIYCRAELKLIGTSRKAQ